MQISNTRITAGVRFTIAPGGGGGAGGSPLTFSSLTLSNSWWNAGPVTSTTGVFMAGGSEDGLNLNGVFLNSDGGRIAWGDTPAAIRRQRFITVALASNETARSTDYSAGTWAADAIPSGDWTGVAAGLGKAVAVRSGSASGAYSLNGGDTWQTSTLPASAEWTGVAFGRGAGGFNGTPCWVAVAANSSQAAYSLDGITWQNSTLPFSGNWRGIAYAGTDFNSGSARNTFFAVASGSDVAAWTTDGGINWSNTASLGSAEAWSVIGGLGINSSSPGIVIMAPGNSTAKGTLVENPPVWNSIDLGTALDWSAVSGIGPQTQDFVAIARGSDATVTGSGGALTWSYGANLPSAAQWSSMVSSWVYYGNLLAVASGGTTAAIGLGSFTGLTWSSATLPATQNWSSVTAGAGIGGLAGLFAGNVSGNPAYVAQWTPVSPVNDLIYTTDFGATWLNTVPLANAYSYSIQGYFNNQWVAIANLPGAASYYFTSNNLTSWSNTTGLVPGGDASSAPAITTFAEGRYIAIDGGSTSNVWYSTNLTSWSNVQITDPAVNAIEWLPVVYGNGRFVTVSKSASTTSQYAYSDDGVTWNNGTFTNNGDNPTIIGYANSVFFVGGTNFGFVPPSTFNPPSSNLYTSPDGITWTVANANISSSALFQSQQDLPAAVDSTGQVAFVTSGDKGSYLMQFSTN